MENYFPIPIMNEKDLKVYEDYLKKDHSKNMKPVIKGSISQSVTNLVFLPAYLKNHIGKLVKIEVLVGNRMECRVGILLEVGADFLVIKLKPSGNTTIICGNIIKFITIR